MTYDHTSLLSSVEKLYGLASLTRRDAAAKQFLDLFSQITAREDTVTLPAPLRVEDSLRRKKLAAGDLAYLTHYPEIKLSRRQVDVKRPSR